MGGRDLAHYLAAMKLVATVFEVEPQHAPAFRAAALANALAVERSDPACKGVAIAEDPSAPGFFLTSALYASDDEAQTRDVCEAGRAFEEAVRRIVKLKRVRTVNLG